jgi:hypothetical protein
LGRFLFALAEWGLRQREYIHDLIPRVLQQAGRPLTCKEVLDRLRHFRSVSPTGFLADLRRHPQVRDFGLGRFGLISWAEQSAPKSQN